MATEVLKNYCERWNLQQPRVLAITPTSEVYDVTQEGTGLVLKILSPLLKKTASFEVPTLQHFNGQGSVRLYQFDEGALLLEKANGENLRDLYLKKQDQEALYYAAETINKLHRMPMKDFLGLNTMESNFRSLFVKASREPGSIYAEAADKVQYLLDTSRDFKILHGDLHHTNIVYSSGRGWLAIDPKGLLGERAYDIANLFYNPLGFGDALSDFDVIEYRSHILSQRVCIEQKRILQYAFVYGALSAAWHLEDQTDVTETLKILNAIRTFSHNRRLL